MPRHPGSELRQPLLQEGEEGSDPLFGDEEDLQGRAPLTVEGQGPKETLLGGVLQVRPRQKKGDVLRLQSQERSEAVGAGVKVLQPRGDTARTDEGQQVDLP